MVHFDGSGALRMQHPEAAPYSAGKFPVKLEIEDSLEEEHGPFHKRIKQQGQEQLLVMPDQWSAGNNLVSNVPSEYNPLDEPSPLGLRLRKSPSLLELIQMRLSQGKADVQGSDCQKLNSKEKSITKSGSGAVDKLKASNFPASLLRIGRWEYVSRYEGDLVAKCYFAKHKLVWEILDGGLKSKIEIQWSDIMGLKANLPENEPATLTVALARQPLFFRETNPQPRKHTLWQATGDFTNEQASSHRQHFLQVPFGLLNKHFEKLIQCDMRLNFLSRQPEIILDSPYFDTQSFVLVDSSNHVNHGLDQCKGNKVPSFYEVASPTMSQSSVLFDQSYHENHGLDQYKGNKAPSIYEVASPSMSQSSSINIMQEDLVGRRGESLSREAPSPSSVMDMRAIEGSGGGETDNLEGEKNWEQSIMQGLRPSISVTDLVNHIGSCISGQVTYENPSFTEERSEPRKILEDIAHHLLSDFPTTVSDERSIMSRVNSLCCLLPKDTNPVQSMQFPDESGVEEMEAGKHGHQTNSTQSRIDVGVSGDGLDVSNCKQAPSMSRKDSYGDLLLHLPRIASLPKLLFDISEDLENQAR